MSREPSKAHYRKVTYWSHLRIHGYANQLRELYVAEADTVLEVGMADGYMSTVVPRFTRHRLVSVDLDPALGPDVAGSVVSLPFGTNAFDVVVCCQVLEHLPFESFGPAVRELGRVARRLVFLSVPDVRMYLALRLRVPKLGWRTLAWSPERYHLGPYRFDGEHHWEIGYRGTRFRDVRRTLERSGVRVIRSYRIPDLPYHCFFVLDPGQHTDWRGATPVRHGAGWPRRRGSSSSGSLAE